MTPLEKRVYGLLVILMVMAGGAFVYSQTPPGPNTIEHGQGINSPTITATDGYFYGVTNVTGSLFGDFGAWDISTSGDYYHGTDNLTGSLYGQFGAHPITTTGALTTSQINTGPGFTEVYPMDQAVTTGSDVDFNSVNISDAYYINGVDISTLWGGPGVMVPLRQPYTYGIWRIGSTYYVTNSTGYTEYSTGTCQNAFTYVFTTKNDAKRVLIGPGYYEFSSINLSDELASTGNSGVVIEGYGAEGYGTTYHTQLKLNGDPGIYAVGDDYAGGSTVTLVNLVLRNLCIRGGATNTLLKFTGRQENFLFENIDFLYGKIQIYFDDCYGSSIGGTMRNCIFQPWDTAGGACIKAEDLSHWSFYECLWKGNTKAKKQWSFNITDGTTGFSERLEFHNCQFNNIYAGFYVKVDSGMGEVANVGWYGGIIEAVTYGLWIEDVSGRADFHFDNTDFLAACTYEIQVDEAVQAVDITLVGCRMSDATPEVVVGASTRLRSFWTRGYNTEWYGTDTLANGETLDTFAHNLHGTPDHVEISWTDDVGGKSWYWTANATHVNVTISAAAGANYDYSWHAWFSP